MNKNGFDSNHMHANKKVFFTSLIFLIIFLACWGFTGFFNQKKVSEVEQEYVFVDADQMITDYQSNKRQVQTIKEDLIKIESESSLEDSLIENLKLEKVNVPSLNV